MRTLGIDYGTKRIGIALSDEEGKFALPFSVVKNSPAMIAEIMEIAKLNTVTEVVIGESKDYEGKDNKIMEETKSFKKDLEKLGFKVFWEPEFMTSMHNERLQGKHDKSDSSAAAIILQSFLDKRNSEGA